MNTIKLGSKGNDVITLRSLLDFGDNPEFDNDLDIKVKNFQKCNGLVDDGIVGAKTWLKLFINSREESSKDIKLSDYIWAGKYLDCEPETIMAVIDVETGGKSGFLAPNKPQILFEGHIFWKELEKLNIDPNKYSSKYPSIVYKSWTKKYYKGGLGEYDRLNIAMNINKEAAIKSTSWGMFQVMGTNYKLCSCNNVIEFYDKECDSQFYQFVLGLEFIRNTGLYKYLKTKDWASFARGYNGSGYKENKYDEKLKMAYKKYKKD